MFLATWNVEHSKTSPKDRVTIDATGMYIPTRTHFKHLLEMGLGYLHIQRGVGVARSGDIASSTATGCGTSNNEAPAFLFTLTKLPLWSQWLRSERPTVQPQLIDNINSMSCNGSAVVTAEPCAGVSDADIKENHILELSSELLTILLKDHTLSPKDGPQVNIFWATDNYEPLGKGYHYHDQITIPCITGANGNVIVPRSVKSRQQQQQRSREMAEVFTPSWICNAQNNLVDSAWFGREGVFNTENPDHNWTVNPDPITFPEGKTWRDYVRDTRLEITCGEAPYIVSRYDTVTGEPIPVEQRIGLLDRKLRVVSENTESTGDWLKWAQTAYMSVYGYEWQGDNLLLARENLIMTFVDYFKAKFGEDKMPQMKSLHYIAYIISWNFWQMDGLKGVVPDSCGDKPSTQPLLFDFGEPELIPCEGCKSGNIRHHNGIYCLIRDWSAKTEDKKKIRFIDLIKN